MNEPKELVRCDTSLDFSCRGCGSKCCRTRDVQLTAIDFWRLAWHTKRFNIEPAQVYMIVDEGTGLPAIWMAEEPCPFLRVVNQIDENGYAQPAGQEWCAVWKERPNECRTFPVTTELQLRGDKDVLVVQSVENCPGSGKRDPQALPRTVYQYARQQIGGDRWIELFVYATGVIHVLRTQGLYWEGAGGRLTDKQVLDLGARFLFQNPPMSPDPRMDHDLAMSFMAVQVEFLKKGGLSHL